MYGSSVCTAMMGGRRETMVEWIEYHRLIGNIYLMHIIHTPIRTYTQIHTQVSSISTSTTLLLRSQGSRP